MTHGEQSVGILSFRELEAAIMERLWTRGAQAVGTLSPAPASKTLRCQCRRSSKSGSASRGISRALYVQGQIVQSLAASHERLHEGTTEYLAGGKRISAASAAPVKT